jgi:hypothetical protein
LKPLLEVAEFTFGTTTRQVPVFDRGNAGGVVPAIFQPPQGIEQQRRHRLTADDPDYSAHL